MNKDMVIITSKEFYQGTEIPSVTQQLFGDKYKILYLEDIGATSKDREANIIKKSKNFPVVMFSGIDTACECYIRKLKKADKKVIVYWHYTMAVLTENCPHRANWNTLVKLAKDNQVDLVIFCKGGLKSMWENISAVRQVSSMELSNTVRKGQYYDTPKKDIIGLYLGDDCWIKNSTVNLLAIAMTGKKVDITPISASLVKMAELMCMEVTESKKLPHEEFVKRMATCELITYVTYAEACPMLPLEALENGVLCICGNNTAYYKGHPLLEEYLICKRPDDVSDIYDHIQGAIKHKNEIFEDYAIWKREWDASCQQKLDDFQKVVEDMAKSRFVMKA